MSFTLGQPEAHQQVRVRPGGDPGAGHGFPDRRQRAVQAHLREHREDQSGQDGPQIPGRAQNQQASRTASRQNHADAEDKPPDDGDRLLYFIYFDVKTQEELIQKFFSMMKFSLFSAVKLTTNLPKLFLTINP